MEVAVLRIEHFRPFVDLQRDAHVPLCEQSLEMRFRGFQQGVSHRFVDGAAATPAHAQVEIHKRVVTGIARGRAGMRAHCTAGGPTICHSAVRCRKGQYPNATGRKDLFVCLVANRQHGVRQGAAQGRRSNGGR